MKLMGVYCRAWGVVSMVIGLLSGPGAGLANAATLAPVQIGREDTNLVLTFPATLQHAAQAQGPFTNVPGARSPHRTPLATAPAGFWRAHGESRIGMERYLSAGGSHVVALRTDGSLWAWGNNSFGQLGNGTKELTNNPQPIATNATWLAVSAGQEHNLAIQAGGALWAWGAGTDGVLGNGAMTNSTRPLLVDGTVVWRSVTAGSTHSLALRADGTLWAWGYNHFGQLGNGTVTRSLTPQPIGAGATWQAVAAGYHHTAALQTDGTLWTWGNNYSGQLGNGSLMDTTQPQQVGTNATWQAVAAGGFLVQGVTAAIRSDGTLWMWGGNRYGQLGIGTLMDANVPQQVGTNSNWRAVAVGADHTLGLQEDGSLWTWGDNSFGQLGNGRSGSLDFSKTPQRIGTNSTWLAAAGGLDFSVALQADGSLWAWGSGTVGQLGNGASTNASSPQRVLGGNVWGSPPE